MMTASASPRNRAGPDTAGPVTTMITGTTPEQRTSARAAVPQPCAAPMPAKMSAPLDSTKPMSGMRFSSAVKAANAMLSPSWGDNAPWFIDPSIANVMTS